jgi:hypothetical protein
VQILNNHTENFGNFHYQLLCPFQFQKISKQKMCVVSTIVLLNNINLLCERSRLPEIVNLPTGLQPKTRGHAYQTVYNQHSSHPPLHIWNTSAGHI